MDVPDRLKSTTSEPGRLRSTEKTLHEVTRSETDRVAD